MSELVGFANETKHDREPQNVREANGNELASDEVRRHRFLGESDNQL
jgi:hypothetical protein